MTEIRHSFSIEHALSTYGTSDTVLKQSKQNPCLWKAYSLVKRKKQNKDSIGTMFQDDRALEKSTAGKGMGGQGEGV